MEEKETTRRGQCKGKNHHIMWFGPKNIPLIGPLPLFAVVFGDEDRLRDG
jgi:hypothetical protein